MTSLLGTKIEQYIDELRPLNFCHMPILMLSCLSFSFFFFSIAVGEFLQNISISPFLPLLFLLLSLLVVEISTSSSLSWLLLIAIYLGLMGKLSAFSLYNFQSSFLTFFWSLGASNNIALLCHEMFFLLQ